MTSRTEKHANLYKFFSITFCALFLFLIFLGGFDAFHTPSIGLTLDSNLTATVVAAGSPAETAGFRVGDQVISIDGNPVRSREKIASRGRNLQINQQTTYKVQHPDGSIRFLRVTWNGPDNTRKWNILLNAFCSIVILISATWLIFRHPFRVNAFLFYILCIFYLFFRMDHPRWQNEIWSRVYQAIYLICFFLIPPVFAHFCAVFPRKNGFFAGHSSRVFWMYAPSVILSFPAAVTNWMNYRNLTATTKITKLIICQGVVIWTVLLTIGVLMMIHAFMKLRSRQLARRCSLVFYALFLAVAPYLAKSFFNADGAIVNLFALVFFLPLPITLAWTIDFGPDEQKGIPWMYRRFL